jgi:hypothetical protein
MKLSFNDKKTEGPIPYTKSWYAVISNVIFEVNISYILSETVPRVRKTYYRINSHKLLFLWRRAPQQKLRTHLSLKAYCVTLWWRWRWWLVFPTFPYNGAPVEWNWQGKTEALGEKPVPVPHSNPDYRGGRPATNRLSHGVAPQVTLVCTSSILCLLTTLPHGPYFRYSP